MRDADTCALSTPERAPPLEVCHWTGECGRQQLDGSVPTCPVTASSSDGGGRSLHRSCCCIPSHAVLFVHTICNADPANKRAVLRKLGFWFLDSEGEGGCPTDGAASRLPRCRPLRWRDPAAEAVHLGCSQHRLALTSAVASEEEFERLRQRISGLEQRVQAAAP